MQYPMELSTVRRSANYSCRFHFIMSDQCAGAGGCWRMNPVIQAIALVIRRPAERLGHR